MTATRTYSRAEATVDCGIAIHPGEYLRDELEARGWTQTYLAKLIGRPLQVVNEIVHGKKGISAQTAVDLAGALGTSAEVWLNLDSRWRLACEYRRRAGALAITETTGVAG